MSSQTEVKLWGGRFRGKVDPVMVKFNESISIDKRMWKADIIGSKAYAKALHKCGVLTLEEAQSIRSGLDSISLEWEKGAFVIEDADEDIHTANERRLTEIIGSVAGKLHTGRSRNDQVATDMRLYMREVCSKLDDSIVELIGTATQIAEKNIDVLMPGFTHLQPAQPIRFSHWMMSHVAAFIRDTKRLRDIVARINVLPLGSGALAGNAFGVDREFIASELNFSGVSMNSLDAVSNRDFVAEFLFWSSMTMIHLSQLSEDLIVYNTMRCVNMADAYCTGSSLMPQKKNPDALELLRGKTGTIVGRLSGFLVTLKGLPRSYNKDLQEDKTALFDCVDTMKDCLEIATGVLATMSPDAKALRALLQPSMLATDLAEYLVRKGVPFRETHHISGAAVRLAEDKGISLDSLTLDDLKSLHPKFEADVVEVWDFEKSIERKDVRGGTSKSSVLDQIDSTQSWINVSKTE